MTAHIAEAHGETGPPHRAGHRHHPTHRRRGPASRGATDAARALTGRRAVSR